MTLSELLVIIYIYIISVKLDLIIIINYQFPCIIEIEYLLLQTKASITSSFYHSDSVIHSLSHPLSLIHLI